MWLSKLQRGSLSPSYFHIWTLTLHKKEAVFHFIKCSFCVFTSCAFLWLCFCLAYLPVIYTSPGAQVTSAGYLCTSHKCCFMEIMCILRKINSYLISCLLIFNLVFWISNIIQAHYSYIIYDLNISPNTQKMCEVCRVETSAASPQSKKHVLKT